MAQIEVDLYSDTVTRPTPAMRQAMAEAEVGNEQANEDPTVNRLCEMAADLMGHEAAVYVPSGTMCNAIAYRVHCEPGDEVILDSTGHPLHAETGRPAALAGVMCQPIEGKRGIFEAAQLEEAIRPYKKNRQSAKLISVEQTSNFGGGSVWPLDSVKAVTSKAREHGLATHMDGARLLNAVVASGVSAKDYASQFDSAWLDLSKGLGCPVGAVLCGSHDFVDRAWRFKHQFGGAMRQAGIIAGAGVYALENNVDRLAEDHENAQVLARGLAEIEGLSLNPNEVETNIVFFDVSGTGMSAEEVHERLLDHRVRIGVRDKTWMRAVTHLDVDRAGIERTLDAMRKVCG